MCISFISRKGDMIIGMNFDNNGMKYSIRTETPGVFAVYVDGGRGKCASFGVRSGGTFVNNLVVDTKALSDADNIDVDTAFGILDAAKQHSGEWITELTMVYSKKADSVYYRTNEENAKIYTLAF